MGSPVSVVVANLVMEDVEQRALCTFAYPPRIWKRYVDDTFCIIGAKHIDCFHQHLNSLEMYTVYNGERVRWSDPLLDVLVKRENDGTVSTGRKLTQTST